MAKNKGRIDQRSNQSGLSKVHAPMKPTRFFVPVRDVLMISFLALLVFLIYSNTLGSPLLFDDEPNIQNNPHIRLTKLTPGGMARAGLESPSSNRPVANISFALNYYVHQYNVMGYHLINILIHITTGIFLYLFVKTTLNLPSLRSRYEHYPWIPFLTALIWLLHPLQTQSVTYIVQRMNSMAAMFYVFSLLLYAKARLAEGMRNKRALFAGCIISGILALGSKENAATLPFFILLYEWYFFQDLSWTWVKRHILPLAALLIFFAIMALMYLGIHPLEKILTAYELRDFTLTQRVLTQFRVIIFYITLLIFPHPSRLNLDHDFPVSHSLMDPLTTIISLGVIGASMGLAIYMAKKQRLLSFCILWFLGNLAMESSVIGLEIVFEHRTYLPSMFVILMAVTLAYGHIKPKWWRVGALCAVVMFLSFWTYERNGVWRDGTTLWTDCVKKSPKKARPYNNLGIAFLDKNKFKEAMSHFEEALRLKPDYLEVHNNMGAAFAKQGKLRESMSAFSEVLRLKPDDADAHNNMGVALLNQGKFKEAMDHFSNAVHINPTYADAHCNMGAVLAKQGKLKEAMSHYAQALRIKPHSAEAHNNMGNALKRQGKPEEAMSFLHEALRINPRFAEAHYNMGDVLKRQGKVKEAINYYYEALRINPDHPKAHHNLGLAMKQQGKLKEAMSHFSEALRIKPDYTAAHNNMGVALARQNNLKEAMSHFAEALQINPDDADAHYNLGNALVSQGQFKEAMSHYSEALRIKPGDAEARESLERVLGLMDKKIADYE